MFTIKENIEHEYIIKKSRFICNLIKIDDAANINNILTNIKQKYKGSNHNCYAYIANNLVKASDDKEPSGTAGIPMLNLLKNNNLNNILCVITRYFGGIKLGTGGLLRAYTTTLKETLEESEIIELKEYFKYTITFNYDKTKIVDNLLLNAKIIDKSFNDLISYTFIIDSNINELLILNDINILNIEIILN